MDVLAEHGFVRRCGQTPRIEQPGPPVDELRIT